MNDQVLLHVSMKIPIVLARTKANPLKGFHPQPLRVLPACFAFAGPNNHQFKVECTFGRLLWAMSDFNRHRVLLKLHVFNNSVKAVPREIA